MVGAVTARFQLDSIHRAPTVGTVTARSRLDSIY